MITDRSRPRARHSRRQPCGRYTVSPDSSRRPQAAAVAGIIARAAARSPHEIAFDLDDDYVLTYICLAESLQTWGAIQRWLVGVEGGNKERELLSARAAEMLTAVEAAADGNQQ